jgi:signal transduction histidine kinase/DNA-binding LacI/PurR family transcriptional regulator/AraC-like DNA-binding protein
MGYGIARSRNRPGERTSVGLVLASLHTGASAAAVPGVARAAEAAGVNLFCFPGGRLGLREGYEASRNSIYDLAALAPLDGALVWASSLSGASAGSPEIGAFLRRYADIATASLSAGVSGVPVVTFDYYGGMRDVVLHAVRVHGYRRLAFIRGPANHPGAAERLRAFRDALGELAMDADPRLESSPWPWDSGRQAASELLDCRGLAPGRDFDAVLASSDLMAIAALRELQSRGYRVPEELALFGMNNSVESRAASPQLTTVDCPFAELGAKGLSTLLDEIAARKGTGPRPPEELRLGTSLVVRRSCGCPQREGEGPNGAADDRGLASLEERVAAAAGLGRELERDWAEPLLESWEALLRGEGLSSFLDRLGRILDRACRAGMEIGPWQAAITELRRDGLVRCSGRAEIEEAIDSARLLAAEAAERAQAARAWAQDKSERALRELDRELITALDIRRIGEILRRDLPGLGIRSAYLCRYEGEGASGSAVLAAGFRDGEGLTLPVAPFPAADLLPRGLFPDRRLSYVVEPLFFRERALGYALFETGDAPGAVYERLRDSVSNALRGVLLFERAEEARERAERADGVKTRLLTSVTHELKAPVDMMLRGASRLLAEKEALGIGPEAEAEIERITRGAEHERALVGDLLDFSRAELDELDIERLPVDACAIVRDCFELYASRANKEAPWKLDAPARSPLVLADPLRLRQILVNLLSNAERHAAGKSVTVSAGAEPPDFVVRVEDRGPGIEPARLERLFEPFLPGGSGGVGLGLSIARQLALLHFGSLEAANAPGGGALFTLRIPLPDAESLAAAAEGKGAPRSSEPCLLYVSSSPEPPREIARAAASRGLGLRRISIRDTEDGTIDRVDAAAIAWDSSGAGAAEAAIFRRLRRRPRLSALPFLLYGDERAAIVDKGSSPARLAEALSLALHGQEAGASGSPEGPDGKARSIVVADDDPAALEALRASLSSGFPDAELLCASDGGEAWSLLRSRRPLFAVLDISMPALSGIEVLKLMRSDERLRAVPAVLLTSKLISMDDVRRIASSSRVVLGSKGVADGEAAQEAARMAAGSGSLPAGASAIVKRAVAFIDGRYASPLARWQIAQEVGASEDYLSRAFRKELGLTPWEYLTRLRVERAKELLAGSSESVASVGARVGFPDRAYFSRVFKKVEGKGPQAYRDSPD